MSDGTINPTDFSYIQFMDVRMYGNVGSKTGLPFNSNLLLDYASTSDMVCLEFQKHEPS